MPGFQPQYAHHPHSLRAQGCISHSVKSASSQSCQQPGATAEPWERLVLPQLDTGTYHLPSGLEGSCLPAKNKGNQGCVRSREGKECRYISCFMQAHRSCARTHTQLACSEPGRSHGPSACSWLRGQPQPRQPDNGSPSATGPGCWAGIGLALPHGASHQA